ncbi:MAG: hypothetical protein P8R02_12930 [Pseudomonadales bacterium]|nr:hypothetical protein [Pseudomonadales bacterium]
MTTPISSRDDIVATISSPKSIEMDISSLRRGIDNYHVDVHLSDGFLFAAIEVIEKTVKRIVAGSKSGLPAEETEVFRETYRNMMRTNLHRAKADLDVNTINFLQFGVIKFVLQQVHRQLDSIVKQLEESIGQQQFSGSRNLLPTQERLGWIRKHSRQFLFRVNRLIFELLQREENGLREQRKQLLGDVFPEQANIIFNPMLSASGPRDIHLLVDCYGLWPGQGEGITNANLLLEDTLGQLVPEYDILALKTDSKLQSLQSEVYDTLHGLFNSQDLLGPSENQNEMVTESFCWLEQPANYRIIFDASIHESALEQVKQKLGRKAHWSFKSEVKKLLKVAAELRKKMFSEADLKQAIAAYLLRGKWSIADEDLIELPVACAYIAGNDKKKLLSRVDQTREGAAALIKRLDDLVENVDRQFKDELDEVFLKLLADLGRYRLHLKYFRFAHRVLNRISVITEPQEIQLARAGGRLYELLAEDENQLLESSGPEVIHHCILKADVRGSTRVTEELSKRDLNPASYFSLRFFNPITDVLPTYGASKVFIEGDAVILSVVEESNRPDQWYSVSRSCGLAKEILDIVRSKNSHSLQTELPSLEIGIGISYRDESPVFLFDENRPIMISGAIGEADRLSSCSWQLRDNLSRSPFNVDVLSLAESEQGQDEKGQDYSRYNVNGILLEDVGFKKLMSEIPLKKFKIKVGDNSETMFVGRFPDVAGKERELVIREGLIRGWVDGAIVEAREQKYFYEVLPNSKLASQVLEVARKQLG